MTVFLYNRVSHRDSEKSDVSIPIQEAAGRAYAQLIPNSGGVVSVSDNAVSGWSKPFATRPGGRAILAGAQPGDHVVCYRIDRLARNLRDFCNTTHYFENRGIFVHYIHNQINTATSSGKFQANIMAAMAQYSSDITSERTREALLIKKLRGDITNITKKRSVWSPSDLLLRDGGADEPVPQSGRALLYERVSTVPQYVSGLGLEHQSSAIQRYANGLGFITESKLYSDPAISAYSVPFAERPAGKLLMNDIQAGDHVIIYRLDRGWRNTLDASRTIEAITERGAFIHFVCEGMRTDTGRGKEWINLMASIAQLESQLRSERIKEAMAYCRSVGRPTSDPRFGLRAETTGNKKRLTIDKKDALTAAIIWVLRHEYNMSEVHMSDTLGALTARQIKKPVNIRMCKKARAHRKLQQAETLRSIVGEHIWNEYLEKARQTLKKPFEPMHWRSMRWNWRALFSTVEPT